MKFYVGLHQVSDAHKVDRAFISAHRLARRRSGFQANEWIMDSGAFTTIEKHGGYPESVEAYADIIERFRGCGNCVRVVAQDFMCEDFMLERTQMDIRTHQQLTVSRYVELRRLVGDIAMPVLQGYAPEDYAVHARMYGQRLLRDGTWIGVGSVCKRQGNPSAIAEVLDAIHAERPDLRLHGFGIKLTALADARVRDRLYSADSMAWSWHERINGRDGNSVAGAQRYVARVENQAVQESLL